MYSNSETNRSNFDLDRDIKVLKKNNILNVLVYFQEKKGGSDLKYSNLYSSLQDTP